MNKEKLDSFIISEVAFIGEQIGIPENEFKESVLNLFQEKNKVFRAYLSQVKYLKMKECNVALCIATSSGEDEELASIL